MEIEIDSKRNNPLLNRTEVYFTIKHGGEATPNREIIKSELADKLNVKKESIMISSLDSSFGVQQVTGYAKIYSSDKKAKESEFDYVLKRNKVISDGKKGEKKEASAKAEARSVEPAGEEKPAGQPLEPAPEAAKSEVSGEKPEKPAKPVEERKPEPPKKEVQEAKPEEIQESVEPEKKERPLEPASEDEPSEQKPDKEPKQEKPAEKPKAKLENEEDEQPDQDKKKDEGKKE